MERSKIPYETQVRVFYRDQWLCYVCHRPTIFSPALKYMQMWAQDSGCLFPISYYHEHWRRDLSPLADELGVVIDHFQPHSKSKDNREDNLKTACNKCNSRKSDKEYREFVSRELIRHVNGKYGEPQYWDGLSSVFVLLAEKYLNLLTLSERQWLKAFRVFLTSQNTTSTDSGIKS